MAGTRLAVEAAAEPTPELAYITGPDGAASIGLPPGEVRLRVFLPDGTSRATRLRVGDEPGGRYEVAVDA